MLVACEMGEPLPMKSARRISLRWVALTASIVCAASLATENSDAQVLDQLRDLWPALSECWQPPSGSAGMCPTGWEAQSPAGRFHFGSSPPPNRVGTMAVAGI